VQPVMLEQHMDRLVELGICEVKVAVLEDFEVEDGGVETRRVKRVANSNVVGKIYTSIIPFAVLNNGNWLQPFYKGDQLEVNKTSNNNGTGVSYVLNHLPKTSPYRRISTSFRKIDQIFSGA